MMWMPVYSLAALLAAQAQNAPYQLVIPEGSGTVTFGYPSAEACEQGRKEVIATVERQESLPNEVMAATAIPSGKTQLVVLYRDARTERKGAVCVKKPGD